MKKLLENLQIAGIIIFDVIVIALLILLKLYFYSLKLQLINYLFN